MKHYGVESLDCRELNNGTHLFVHPSKSNHVVALHIILPFVAATETEQNAGVTSFSLRMLRRGTATHTAQEFEMALDDLGTELGTSTGKTTCAISLHCTDDALNESINLLREMISQPVFDPEELERERRITLAGLRKAEDNSMGKTLKLLHAAMYPNSGYGLPVNGLEPAVREFRREIVIEQAKTVLQTPKPIVVCVGNCDPDTFAAQCETLFSPQPRKADALQPPPVPMENTRVSFERKCNQSTVAIGWRIGNRLAKDFPAIRLVSAVLGESMSSRLFLHLRDEQGLAYATGSHISAGMQHGEFISYIATKPQTREHAYNEMLRETETLRNELVPQDELDRARNSIVGKLLIGSQSNLSRAARLGTYICLGLGTDGEKHYLDALAQVTPQQVRDAAQHYLTNPVCGELIAKETEELETTSEQ